MRVGIKLWCKVFDSGANYPKCPFHMWDIWARLQEKGSLSRVVSDPSKASAQPLNRARDKVLQLKAHLVLCIVWANSEGSGETAVKRLCCCCDKSPFQMGWFIWLWQQFMQYWHFWHTGSSAGRVSAFGNGRSRVRPRAVTYQSRSKWY